MRPIVTLTTDFGTADGYVAAMKGRILSRCPDAALVDISHDIPPQDVMTAAFILRETARNFPAETVHLAVVDPTVGTERRAVAVRHTTGEVAHRFVGPDNGLFALVLGTSEPDEAVELNRAEHWDAQAVSATFHGRDIFAPIAATLASGMAIGAVGTPVEALRAMRWVEPVIKDDGISAWIAHVDRFGNAITNVPAERFSAARRGRPFKAYAGATKLTTLARTYADVEPGEAVLLVGSHGFVEIAVRQGNAAELLSIRPGAPVHFVFQDD